MAWADAFTFANQILIAPTATHVGGITWNAPWQLPVPFGSGPTPPVYAQSFSIKPCGASGGAIPNKGMLPGEFYTNAIVTVHFDSISYIQQTSDDPLALNQLDPANPITACEQSVEINGKIVTTKGASWLYTSGSYSEQKRQVARGSPVKPQRGQASLCIPARSLSALAARSALRRQGQQRHHTVVRQGLAALGRHGNQDHRHDQRRNWSIRRVEVRFQLPTGPHSNATGGLDWNSFDFPDGSGTSILNSSDGSGKTPYKYVNFSSIFTGLLF